MLTIRKEQMDVLEEHMMLQWENRIVATGAKQHPERFARLGEPAIRADVRAGIKKALQYSIESDQPLERFLLMVVEHGFGFELEGNLSWSREILEATDINGDAKMMLIAHQLEG